MIYLYYCSILVRDFSIFINFLFIILFILLLKFFTNTFTLYLLSLAAHLNFWTNSSIVFSLYSTFLSLVTLTNSLFSPPNFFNSIKNSFVNLNFIFSNSKSSNKFLFYILVNTLYTYNNIYWICFFTNTPFILILKYNLYIIMNSVTLLAFLLKIGSLATSICNPILNSSIPIPPISLLAIIIYNTAIYFYYILICSKSWLISS